MRVERWGLRGVRQATLVTGGGWQVNSLFMSLVDADRNLAKCLALPDYFPEPR